MGPPFRIEPLQPSRLVVADLVRRYDEQLLRSMLASFGQFGAAFVSLGGLNAGAEQLAETKLTVVK